jgi:hypothetical protein
LVESTAADVTRGLRDACRRRRHEVIDIEVVKAPRVSLSALSDLALPAALAGRRFSGLWIAMGSWRCTVVDLERERDESRHLHALWAVRHAKGANTATSDSIARVLVESNAALPRIGSVDSGALRWLRFSHPPLPKPPKPSLADPAARAQWLKRLAARIASGVIRAWELDHGG